MLPFELVAGLVYSSILLSHQGFYFQDSVDKWHIKALKAAKVGFILTPMLLFCHACGGNACVLAAEGRAVPSAGPGPSASSGERGCPEPHWQELPCRSSPATCFREQPLQGQTSEAEKTRTSPHGASWRGLPISREGLEISQHDSQ